MSKRNRKNRSRNNRVVRYAINPIKQIQPLGGGGNSQGGAVDSTKPTVYDDKGNEYTWDAKKGKYIDWVPTGRTAVPHFYEEYQAQKQSDLQGVYETPDDVASSNVSKIVDQARNASYDDEEANAPQEKKSRKPVVGWEEGMTDGGQVYHVYTDEDDNDVYYAYCDEEGNEIAWTDADGFKIDNPKKEAPSEEAARAINKEANASEGKKSRKLFANRDDVVGWDEGQTADGRVYHVGFDERGKAVAWEDEDGNEIDNPNKEAKEESNKAAQDVGNDKPIESEKPQEKKEEKEKPKNGKRYDDWEVKGAGIPSERDIAVVTQVRRNLNIGWGDAFKKVADKLRKGEKEKALRMLQKAGYKCLDLYRRAYMVHGDGDVLKYICGDNYQYESGERVRLALQDKLKEIWESGAEKMDELGERLYALGGSEVCAKYGGKVCEGDNDEASKLFSSLGDDWRDFLGDEEEEEALEVPESDQRSEEAAKAVGDSVDDAPVETPKKEDNGKPVVDLAQPDEDDDFYGDVAPAWEESEADDEDVFYEEEALALPKNTQDREEAARELHKDLAKPEAPKPGMVAGRPTDDQIVEGQYYSVNIGDLNLDPDRFQFKLDVDKKTGAGSSLKGGKFNPGLAGVITVWRDPENGKDYVVNGHHRFNLALENGYEGNLTVKYLDVGTADEAKSEGAIENIADSKGTSVDVADIMRSHPDKMTQNYLIERGVSPGVGIMREGAKLAALSEEVYKDVKLGQIDPSFAAVLGEYLPITAENPENEDKQNALYRKYIRPQLDKESTGDYKGKRLTKDDVKNYALAFLGVQGRDRGTQALFDLGLDYSAEFEARLELIRHVRNALRAQKAANSAVARKNAGDILMNGGVATSVDVDAAKRNKKTYSDTLTLFEETIPLQGELNDRFNQFVDKYVGAKNADDKQRIADGATEAVVDFFNGGPRGLIGGQAGSDLRGSETVENDGLVHSDAPGDDRQRDRLDASREGMADPRGGEDGKGGLFSGADSEGDGIEASTAESAPESERRQSSNRERGNASDIGSLMSYDPASVPDSFFTPNYAAQTNNAGQSLTENPAPKQKEIDEGEEEALALPENTQDREEAARELHEDLAQTGDDESAKEPVAAPTPNKPAQTDAAEGSEALDVPPSDQAPDEAVVDAVNREPVETPKEEDIDDSLYKIDEDLAKRAHEARFSHPYVAGNATREYEKDVKDAEKLYDELWDKSTYEYHDRLEDVFNDYKQSLAQWWNDYHGAVASGSTKSEIERLLASRPTFAQYKQDMFDSVPEEGRLESFGTSAEAAANLATYRQMLDEGKYYQVNEQLAENAYRMNSFGDYKPGSANAEYRAEVDEMRKLAEQAKAQKDEETRNKIDGLCRAYEARLARWYDANNRNNASTPSIMIAGGDGMNRRRKEKQNQRRDNIMRDRYNEEKGFEAYYRNKIRGLAYNNASISSDDENAIAKLEQRLAELKELHEQMKDANAYWRQHGESWDGYDGPLKERIDPSLPKIYQTFNLSNSSAEIRRLEARLGGLKARANTSFGGDVEFEGGRVHFNTANNRIQIIHDEKPDRETIDKLKRSGFRWSPRDKAWQRMLNDNGIAATKRLGYLPEDYVAKNLADVPATDSSLAGSITTQYPDLYRDGKRLVDEYKAIPYSGKDSGDKAKEILEFFKNASNDLDEDSFRRLAGVLGFPVKAKTKRGMMNNVSARLTNYALAKPIAPKTHATPLNEQQWDGRRPKSFSIHRLSTGSAIVNFGGDTASGGLAKTLLESRRFTGDTKFNKREDTLSVRIKIAGDNTRGTVGATLYEIGLEGGKVNGSNEEFILDAPCTPENFEKVRQAGFLPADMTYQDFTQSGATSESDVEALPVPESEQPAEEAVADALNDAPVEAPKEETGSLEQTSEALDVPPTAQTSEEAATSVGDAVENAPLFDEGRELFKSFKADYSNKERFDAISAFLKRASKKLKVPELKTFVKDCFGVDASNRRTKDSIQKFVVSVLRDLALTKHKRDRILGYDEPASKDSLGNSDVAAPVALSNTEADAVKSSPLLDEGRELFKSFKEAPTVDGYHAIHDFVERSSESSSVAELKALIEGSFGLKTRKKSVPGILEDVNKAFFMAGMNKDASFINLEPSKRTGKPDSTSGQSAEDLHNERATGAAPSNKEYCQRLKRYADAMTAMKEATEDAARYFDEHGSFEGFDRERLIFLTNRATGDFGAKIDVYDDDETIRSKLDTMASGYAKQASTTLDMIKGQNRKAWYSVKIGRLTLTVNPTAPAIMLGLSDSSGATRRFTHTDTDKLESFGFKVDGSFAKADYSPGVLKSLYEAKYIPEIVYQLLTDPDALMEKYELDEQPTDAAGSVPDSSSPTQPDAAPTNEAPHSNSSAEEPTQPGDAPKQSAASVKADDTVKGSARKPPKTAAKPKKIQTRDYFETAKKRKETLDGRYEYALSAEERQKLPQFKPGDVRLTWTLGGNVSTGGKSSIDFDGKTKRNARGFIIDRPHITMWCQDGISAESFANNFGGRVLRDSAVIPKVQMDFTPGTIAALKRHGYLPYDWNPPFIKRALKSIWKENPRNKGSEPPEKWYSGVYPKGGGITNINRESFYVASLLGSDVCFDMLDDKIAIRFGSVFNPVAESEITNKLKQAGFTEVGGALQSDYSPESIDALRECGILPHDWDSSEAKEYYEAHEGSVKKTGRVSEHVPSHLAEYEETARKQVGGKVYSSRPSAQYSRASERAARLIHRDVAQRERLRSSL